MNLWECNHPGCERTAVGCGSAYGLRAIGWYFEKGPQLFCPAHRPDKIRCTEDGPSHGEPCSICAAEREQRRIQLMIEPALAVDMPTFYGPRGQQPS